MEIATNNQSILSSAHMQPLAAQPALIPGAMLYSGRCGVWQPVPSNTTGAVPVPVSVAMPPQPPAPVTAEVPKESIIANMDFTTTSVIAKRRLSSKKRRLKHLNGSTGSDISTENYTQSPAGSANASPAVISSTSTPMVTERSDEDPFTRREASVAITAATSIPQQAVPDTSHSPATSYSNGVHHVGGSTGHYMSSTHPVGIQVANPVLSQLQQGLNYRFLQEQSLLQQQQQQQQAHVVAPSSGQQAQIIAPSSGQQAHVLAPPSSHAESGQPKVENRSGFKWCVAHITIAKQIQQHKQQNAAASFQVHQEAPLLSSSPPKHPLPPTHSHTPSSFNHAPSNSTPISPKQQQQAPPMTQPTLDTNTIPHLALMQYGLPNSSTAAGALPPGYVALPYSSLPDMQLGMHQPPQAMVPMPAQIQLNGAIPVVKPMMTMADSVLGFNPALQVVGGVPVQQAHLAQLPMAAAAHAGGNHAIMQAPSAVCSWVAPVPVMNSCVVNNPFQPGVMAAPWVK